MHGFAGLDPTRYVTPKKPKNKNGPMVTILPDTHERLSRMRGPYPHHKQMGGCQIYEMMYILHGMGSDSL